MRLIDEYDCVFSVVDYHAITIPYDPALMQPRIINAVMDNIAAGLDPDRCTIFVQSHVREHTELNWLLTCVTPMGELGRMTQFKEKSSQHQDNVNAGLLCYPILQAADILLYRSDAVPVGEDQAQHIEFTREVVRRFNTRFGEYFSEPKTLIGRARRVMGLDGDNKMSKSLNNYIGVTEERDSIWEKLKPAKTDTARVRRTDVGDPNKCNIFSYHQLVTPEAQQKEIIHGCTTAGIGCFDCKKILLDNLMTVLDPIRERRLELDGKPDYVRDVLASGAARCREMAVKTISEVRERMGLDG